MNRKIAVPIIVLTVLVLLLNTWSHFGPSIVLLHDNIPLNSPYLVKPSAGPNLALLPNLTAIAWPNLARPTSSDTNASFLTKPFETAITEEQRATFDDLLAQFENLMIQLDLQDQWFMVAGTLIGSVRHHDIIPWDDDLDVAVNVKYRETI